ncbi:Cytoplasmic and mitochondrial histidine tRNA synthetase [Xylographa opegraphella]|nr:Cytoplasmic and mitochondrial histidine tRNA synthetase [Xylographa opegraphella]
MGKEKVQFQLKTAKGTKDWEGKDMVIRDRIFSTITQVFKRHGAVTIDTPVFELKEILSGKYGEDSKLIYDLSDQGGELCSLRYDLTVPFARWLAMNSSIQNIKRYHIAKVYRRDQPAMTKGRMREFYQCDFDIAGQYDPMLPDAEILRIVCEVFSGLGWDGKYSIKINHRMILDGIFAVCGVPDDKIRTISSAVDKLDKLPWEEVRQEMVEEKGLSENVADKIWDFVQKKGGRDVLQFLQGDEGLKANPSMVKGMEDMELLFSYLEAFGVSDRVEFNLSLARGLDYYTGVIFEVVTEGSAPPAASGQKAARSSKKEKSKDADEDRSNDPSVGVGSVAAGGRYDELVGMFSGKAQIPCVGISFGVDRIFSITKARMEAEKATAAVRSNEVDVYVMAFGGKGFTGLLKERMEVCKMLWDAGIKTEFSYKLKPKLPAQFKLAEANGVPFAVILGEDEVAQGKVKIKEMGATGTEKEGVLVDLKDLVAEMDTRLRRAKGSDDTEHMTVATEALELEDGTGNSRNRTGDDGV